MRRLFPIIFSLIAVCQLSGQETEGSGTSSQDSIFTPGQAWDYLDQASRNEDLWRTGSDSIKEAVQRLLDHSRAPYDSTLSYLKTLDFSNISVQKGDPIIVDTVDIKWLNDSLFIIDSHGWNPDLYIRDVEYYEYPVDFNNLDLSDLLLNQYKLLDSSLFIPDTIHERVIDTAAMRELNIKLYSYNNGNITPPLADHAEGKLAWLSEDTSKVYYALPRTTWIGDKNSPFYILQTQQQPDSIQLAISTLMAYNLQRDSSLILIDDMFGSQIPLWLNKGRDETFRFWVKNFNNDSLSLWIGNPGSKQISLLMEDDVNFNRMNKEDFSFLPSFLPSFLEQPRRVLKKMRLLEPEPIYWNYETSNLFGLSQTYLANWTKGGESTLSTTIDLMGKATYNNKDAGSQWISFARWKFGTIWTKEKGNRVNNDQLELDSKYNLNAWGKIGFSASFYMKTQIAKGFNYPNDSVPVSKFLNPGTITVGLGAEYKPWEKTTVNIAPLSYKTTFVLDTALIDQTRHGIAANKTAKRELGLQIVLNNEVKPFKNFTMINRMRLFSNYLYKPQNVDVDWEMILEQKINWFFSVRLNLHLIYDDDVRFPVYDDNGEQIKFPDGSLKEAPKAQFREFLGLTLSFKI